MERNIFGDERAMSATRSRLSADRDGGPDRRDQEAVVPLAHTASDALRAATSTGSQTGENGGA